MGGVENVLRKYTWTSGKWKVHIPLLNNFLRNSNAKKPKEHINPQQKIETQLKIRSYHWKILQKISASLSLIRWNYHKKDFVENWILLRNHVNFDKARHFDDFEKGFQLTFQGSFQLMTFAHILFIERDEKSHNIFVIMR